MKEVTNFIKEKVQQLDQSDEAFYKKPWFWICVTLIIMCLTRPHVKVTCGNGNGNGNSGNQATDTSKLSI